MYVEPAAYLSQNPHFCKSALARYTQWDFIDLVGKHGIAWHEKTLGQLFCDDSAEQIVNLLLAECEKGGVQIRLRSEIISVERDDEGYTLQLNGERWRRKNWCRLRRPVDAGAGRLAVWL
jgi:predicted flavoprotein YhiN